MRRIRHSDDEWIDAPTGWMGRRELREFASLLLRIETPTRRLVIDWSRVTHLDYRGLDDLVIGLRDLRERGVTVRGWGFSPYVLAIVCFALSPLDIELLCDLAGNGGRSPALDSATQFDGLAPLAASLRLSKN